MPTYEYACTACDERLEAVQSFTDAPLTTCPMCQGTLRKVFSAVGVVFKGSGFYKNDSRDAASKKSSGKSSSDSSAGTGSTDSSAASTTTTTTTSTTPSGSGSGSSGSGSSGSKPATTPTSTPAKAPAAKTG